MRSSNDTIAFIATPLGEGGIGVVQVSGPQATEIAGKLFKGKSASSRADLTKAASGGLFYGTIHDSEGLIDEVLVSVWRANESFTGEELVEINCHGGIIAVRKIMEALLKSGAREGTWEELLDRADFHSDHKFQKEGLDFVQKEALLLLPRARTKLAANMLLTQYEPTANGLSQERRRLEGEVKRLKMKIMDCDTSEFTVTVALLLSGLEALVDSSPFGLALMNPLKVTIAGAPNVGKSTLFNALLREDRALVHHEPGTTRDYVSEYLSIKGIPLELIDTAGLRETDGVEKVGVAWARKLHQEANKIILVLDASRPITQEEREFVCTLDTQKVVPVLNKIDLGINLEVKELERLFSLSPCKVSALGGKGVDDLEKMLIKDFLSDIEKGPHRPIIFTQRQKGLVEEALDLARGFPKNKVCDCFTASEVCEKLDKLERLLHTAPRA